jgi:hypothetical protein
MARETDHSVDSIGSHAVTLVLNQRDEGRYNDGAPREAESSQLVDETLSRASWQQHGAIPSCQDILDCFKLSLSEICLSEDRLQ